MQNAYLSDSQQLIFQVFLASQICQEMYFDLDDKGQLRELELKKKKSSLGFQYITSCAWMFF